MNGIEPFACLQAALEAFAASLPDSRLDKLLPRNFQPSN
ncbi:hypothetical protein [Leisingera caerulea]